MNNLKIKKTVYPSERLGFNETYSHILNERDKITNNVYTNNEYNNILNYIFFTQKLKEYNFNQNEMLKLSSNISNNLDLIEKYTSVKYHDIIKIHKDCCMSLIMDK